MVRLKEEPIHAERGGLLPAEGPPEEHEGGGALHPEEAAEGPVIPEGYILDFTTRRLVPFELPDDPEAANLPPPPPPGWEDEDEEEPAAPTESFVERAQREVREAMGMPAGWQEPEALLPPVQGAKVHSMGPPGGTRVNPKSRHIVRTKGSPVAWGQRVTDQRTGKTGHWVTNKTTGEHLFISEDGVVYHSDDPVQVAGEQEKVAAGMAKRREESARHHERTAAPAVVGEDEERAGRVPAAGLVAGPDQAEEDAEEGGSQARGALRSARGTGGVRTFNWRARDVAAGHQHEIEHGRVMRDFSTSHPVRRQELDRVLHYFDRASPKQRLHGEQWYPKARAVAERWASLARLPLTRVAGIIAAASPQTPWDEVSLINNLQQAHDCIFGGGDCSHWSDSPKRPEKGRQADPETGEVRWKTPNTTGGKMQAIKEGTPVDQVLNGRKVWNFYLTIMGIKPDARRAVVDRHMINIIRGAGGDDEGLDLNEAEYDRYARTIEVAARERGVPSEVMQAVAWLKYQQDIAPQRRAEKRERSLHERGVLPRGPEGNPEPEAYADQLIAGGHYEPAQREDLVHALRGRNQTGLFTPPEGGARRRRRREQDVQEAEGLAPDLQPAASASGSPLDLRRDQHAGSHAQEQRPDEEAQEGEAEKHGWLTIRREVEGESGKPEEQQTRIYVGHDGTILAGPHHLIGRALSDLRGEGSIEGQQGIPGMKPEPYHSVGRQTGGPGAFRDQGKVQHGEAGREMDSWFSHERSMRLFQPEDHLNSLVRRGYIGEQDAQDLLKQAKAGQAQRA